MRSYIKVAGSSVTGFAHQAKGLPCQDKFWIYRAKDRKSAGIALADGAGSSLHAQIGAECVTTCVIPYIKDNFNSLISNPEEAREKIVKYLLFHLGSLALKHKVHITELACTLLFVYIERTKKSVRFIAGHIGDGVIASSTKKEVTILSAPTRGEYANTTYFVTSEGVIPYCKIFTGLLQLPASFMIMSDGAAETLFVRKTAQINRAYYQQMLGWCDRYPQEKITTALHSNLKKGIFREVSADDCSICLMKVT